MAGGSGERFWPLSTKERPKQLLPLLSEKAMIRETVDRLNGLVKSSDIYVATNAIQFDNLLKELPEIPLENIIIEPAFRDTAAAILYGSTYIALRNNNPVIAVLASDHDIKDVSSFHVALNKAYKIASNSNKIVTLGIKPTYPETGYGYIKVDDNSILSVNENVTFFEKPKLDIAKIYFEDGFYLWNSGMFIFRYSTLINEFQNNSKEHIKVLNSFIESITLNHGITLSNLIKDKFELFPRISIDYSIMEKSLNIICLPTAFGWNDIGSFYSLHQMLKEKSDNFNVTIGTKLFSLYSDNNLIISDNKNDIFVSYNLTNMAIIRSKNTTLIIPLTDSQKIKELFKLIN
jgi:mannose-1-phosphate guanylyltransferase